MRRIGLLVVTLLSLSAFGVPPNLKNLPIGLAPWEKPVSLREEPQTPPPSGRIHSLAEWDESESVMTLWQNASLVRELQRRGNVMLLADNQSDQRHWLRWLTKEEIPTDKISFFIVPTDSIWIRDYGPWFILDGVGKFGLVDTVYNRPRPKDNLVPIAIGEKFNIPVYQPGLVHTGGNYYNDSINSGFSSTLVYTENSSLAQTEVKARMQEYLGIERYITSRLAPGLTIEHLDTFGKLVSPDTWVFSEFPEGSVYRKDSETMVALLNTLVSPYGSKYKIFRLKMRPQPGSSGDDFRAYLNSFISNHALYFPAYGDVYDEEAKLVYQSALPGYDIVGVDGERTSWGDSVHCRTRNFLKRDTLRLFPEITLGQSGRDPIVRAEVFPSPESELVSNPVVKWSLDGGVVHVTELTPTEANAYAAALPRVRPGQKLTLFLEAKDTKGIQRTAPRFAETMPIEIQIP